MRRKRTKHREKKLQNNRDDKQWATQLSALHLSFVLTVYTSRRLVRTGLLTPIRTAPHVCRRRGRRARPRAFVLITTLTQVTILLSLFSLLDDRPYSNFIFSLPSKKKSKKKETRKKTRAPDEKH